MSKDLFEIIPLDPLNCSRETWDLYHEYRRTLFSQRFPDQSLAVADETVETNYKTTMEHPEIIVVFFSIIDTTSNKQVGDILCSIPRETTETYKENPGYMEFYLNILENYHRKGIGSLALAKIRDVAVEYKKTLLATDTNYQTGKAFLQTIGAELEVGVENRLLLKDLDWQMVELWCKEGQERSPKTELKCYSSIPDEIIEQFSRIYTETYNQQPWGELDDIAFRFTPEYFKHRVKAIEESGGKWVVFLTMEEDGKISGLTEMIKGVAFKHLITQELTC
jgi:hypothetical protein